MVESYTGIRDYYDKGNFILIAQKVIEAFVFIVKNINVAYNRLTYLRLCDIISQYVVIINNNIVRV